MTTNHSPAPSEAAKDTDTTTAVPPQASTVAESRPADTSAAEASAPTSTAPPLPPGPDLDPEQERMLLGFYADPAPYPELNDGSANLPRSVSPMLAALSEWAHRLAGSGVDVQSLEGHPQELLKAAAFFVNRALLAPRGSHYRVLGLNANASASDIHDHYRYLRRLFSMADPDGTAHAAVMRISEAYVVLRDPARRRAYDASVFGSSALPRLEAERRGVTEGRFSAAPAAGRSKRWLGIAAVFVLVLGSFWWFGGFEEPTVEAPVALAPEGETAAPESTPAAAGSTPAAEPVASAEPGSPQPAAPESGVAAVDEALLDRVEQFAGADPSEGADTTPPAPAPAPAAAAPAAPADAVADTGAAETDAAPGGSASHEEVAAAEPAAEAAADDAATTSQSEPVSAGTAAEAEAAAGPPPQEAAPSAGPEVAVIPVTPQVAPDTAAPKPDAEIEQLLARADRQLADGQLTTPPGNSAADSYREVLRRDPGNSRAAQGMNAIADRYAMLARYRLRRDELSDARTMVERGLELTPNHSGLLAARAEIEARTQALAAARSRAEAAAREEPVAGASAGIANSTGGSPAAEPVAGVSSARPQSGTAAPIQAPPSSAVPASSASPASGSTPAAPASSVATPSAAAATPAPITPVPQAAGAAGSGAAAQVPSVMAAAPPVASTPPPPAPQALQRPEPLSERALNDLVAKFVRYYEGGDLEAFMELFALDAETNSRKGAKGIRQDYMSLFAGSDSRLMRLKDMRWSRSKGEAVGEADFSLSLFGRRESRPSAYEGRLTFRVVEINGEPVIKGLFHRQRKVDDG